jgi:hypothetical protein
MRRLHHRLNLGKHGVVDVEHIRPGRETLQTRARHEAVRARVARVANVVQGRVEKDVAEGLLGVDE